MGEVGFYHLTRTTALNALPRLLGRALEAGQRAMVLCRDVPGVSAALWASTDPEWLPHGSAGDAHAALHPIWLATHGATAAPNGAKFLFLLDGAAPLPGFDRIFDLFDGNDPDAVQAARARWATAKSAGHQLSYWQQGERGWLNKA